MGKPVTFGGAGGGSGGAEATADSILISRLQEPKPEPKSRGLFKFKGLERRQGLALVHISAQLEQLQDTHELSWFTRWTEELKLS